MSQDKNLSENFESGKNYPEKIQAIEPQTEKFLKEKILLFILEIFRSGELFAKITLEKFLVRKTLSRIKFYWIKRYQEKIQLEEYPEKQPEKFFYEVDIYLEVNEMKFHNEKSHWFKPHSKEPHWKKSIHENISRRRTANVNKLHRKKSSHAKCELKKFPGFTKHFPV